jgi:hypothetical protein
MATPRPPAEEETSWLLPWNELLDGRLRRFTRGVDYSGPAEVMEQEARNAAIALGKTAVTFRDDMEFFEYVWVQFMDGKLEEGEPCPKCANTSFEKLQEYFVRCTSCRSFFALTQPKPVLPEPKAPPPVAEVVALKLLSAQGDETDRVGAHEELLLELTCDFRRPVWGARVAFNFFTGSKKTLHIGSPEVTRVPEPEIVRFTLRVAPDLLPPGDYVVDPVVRTIPDKGGDAVRLKADDLRKNVGISDHPPTVLPDAAAERRKFHWGAPTAASGEPMPVTDEWVERGGED